jgi:uncharacterized protein YfaS (alpha-2-macroglobulin family)
MISRNDHVTDLVDDYLHDLLAPSDATRVERHCGECRTCAVALDEARRRLAVLEALPMSEPSEKLVRDTVHRIEQYEQRRKKLRRYVSAAVLGAVAASAAIIGFFHYQVQHIAPTPADLKVFGQSTLLAGSTASLRVCLLDRMTGTPLPGVPVRIAIARKGSEPETLTEFVTDARGTGQPRFTVPEQAGEGYQLVVTAQLPERAETITPTIQIRRSWQVMLTSDKPIYQPGQTIQIRSLALRRPDRKPVAAQPAVFTVADPRGNIIFKQEGKTSLYGIAAADCALASEILEGPYTIACKVGDTDSRLTVDVRKYVLPKFKVGVTLDKPYYAPGQKVTATVESAYFFGKPVAGGVVEFEATAPEIGTKIIHRASTRADAAGKAIVAFDLPPTLTGRPQDAGDARITVQALVTDPAGQKHGGTASTVVTTRPLRIEVIPEGGALVQGVSTRVYLLVTYADGRPARATVEDDAGLKITTDELGVASFPVLSEDGQGLHVVLRATDDRGLRAEQRVQLRCGSYAKDFLLRTDKAVYAGGETMNISILGWGQEPVFVDLIKDGQTLYTETINTVNGEGKAAIDLSPELTGTLQVCAYRLGPEGLPVRKSRVFYVRPASTLDVKAALDRPEYRPGGQAKLTFELRDKTGKPVRGALSLAGVDEAVFAVLKQRPGLEGRFFSLEEELLKPIYAIYPWSPDLERADRDPLEQALFARTSQTTTWQDPLAGARQVDGTVRMQAQAPVEFASPVLALTGSGPHTLAASSFTLKASEAAMARARGLDRVRVAWIIFGVGIAFLVYIALCVFIRPLWVLALLHGLAVVFLCGGVTVLLLPRFAMKAELGGLVEEARFAAKGVDTPQAVAPPPDARGVPREDGKPSIRVREFFPETLLWRPELITDDQGRATLEVPLADSITTWRLTASAVTADGQLGGAQTGIKVFQPFFVDLDLPVALTRGDEVAVPVVVYNYLDRPQTVGLTLAGEAWFECLEGAAKRIELAPHEVRSTSYRLRVKTVGTHDLQVTARGTGMDDAIRRQIEVVPDGQRVEQVANGALAQPAEVTLTVPENAIEGSARAILKIYPSGFSQLVEGLDGIFQRPYGCFEQTSSTTYPNILALDYLRRTNKAAPEVEAKARQYIHLGYQRLLGFEVSGGGFDWFGRPPANRTLTAYGLMEFQDLARVHDVDPNLIDRTRRWLLRQRNADGSWAPESHGMHEDPTRGRGDAIARLSTTAYIAWAVFGGLAPGSGEAEKTWAYLLSHRPEQIDDPYLVALVCKALSAIDPTDNEVMPYLDRLDAMKKASDDGKFFYWEQPANRRTTFYGAGRSGSIETTALATLALLEHSHAPATTRGGLGWLIQQKDARGTWHSTQATVLALKALISGTGQAGDAERRIELTWAGRTQEIVMAKDQAEVMKQIDLSAALKPGTHRLNLADKNGTAPGYQVTFWYHVPATGRPDKPEPLSVVMTYDRNDVRVEESVTATATVTNRMAQPAPMVILDLPIPAGFALDPEDLARLVQAGTIARYQLTARSAVVYLRSLNPGQALNLTYRLRATMPVKVSVPPATAYEYYDTDKQGCSAPAKLTATGR